MSEGKVECQKKAAKRTRGHFVGVYEVKTIEEIKKQFDEMDEFMSHKVLVQVVSETAACKNIAGAKKETEKLGLIGTFVALRRTGDVFQRVVQQVASFVTPKNYEGFNEEQKGESDA